MSQQFLLSFKQGISLIEQLDAGQLVLQSPDRSLTFQSVKLGLNMALKALAHGGATLEQLDHWVQQDDGKYPVLKFYGYLQKFSSLGWLCRSVFADDHLIAMAVPMVSNPQFLYKEIKTEDKHRLSRFAYVHSVEGRMVLESPLSKTQVYLLDWKSTALVALMVAPHTCEELVAQLPEISLETVRQFVSLLLSTHMLSDVLENGTTSEQVNNTLAQWEFHDLLFHTRSRSGRHTHPVGGTYRFLDKIEPLPAIKPQASEEAISLYQPDLENLKITDTPFTQVLEGRHSIRDFGETPITAQQLGEFLYRSVRVEQLIQTERGERSRRPYPSGGGIYELELYPIVNRCQDIPAGLYHYHPQAHQLCRLSSKTESVEALLNDAWQSMGRKSMPQILIVISSRFQRLAWKYASIAYALTLKNVGVLYQTMYLVATAMDLASCSIGTGNSEQFIKAAGCDYYAETSVGEFALGSMPT